MPPDQFEAEPPWLDVIDHTADINFVVHAPSVTVLYERAAWAMFSVLTDMGAVRPEERTAISVEAPDRDALMLRWLSELNFEHTTHGKVFSEFTIRTWTDTALTADILGETIDPARHPIHTEIKAVTFHGLKIEERASQWHARILFDV